jgi:MFS transporter, UMF1 family
MRPGNAGRWGFFLYDFASSGYVVVFGTFLFPLWFRDQLLADDARADFWWGLCVSASVVVAGLTAPLVGHAADRHARRRVLGVVVALAFAGVATLATATAIPAPPAVAVATAFVLTHALYVLSVALCDSYLSHLGEDRAATSSFAWGFGYLGGVVCLVGVLVVQGRSLTPAPAGFWVTAVFFGAVAAVAVRLLPADTPRVELRLRDAVRAVARPRLFKTLLAFWLINEGIVTVMFFSAIFGRETLELPIPTIGAIFVAVQLLAFPATAGVGRLARRFGTPPVLLGTVVAWCGLLVGLATATTAAHYATVSLLGAGVLGSTQALMRAWYSRLYPQESAGLSFGLYALVTKSSTVVGPLMFGLVASATASQRIAVLCTLLPLIAGGALFAVVSRPLIRTDRRPGETPH